MHGEASEGVMVQWVSRTPVQGIKYIFMEAKSRKESFLVDIQSYEA